jgi:hypothetical protein
MTHGIKKLIPIGKHNATPLEAADVPAIHREMPVDWYPSKTEQDMILADNITSNWKYRRYLTRNAVGVMEDNHWRATEMSGDSSRPYQSTTHEDRRAHIAGMVVGHGMGESGDMRRRWLAESSAWENASSPFIVMNSTPVAPADGEMGKKYRID